MPKKIKTVKKLRSSKPKSNGMTEISIEKLRKVVEMEKHIEELKDRLDHPDYYDLGRPHAHHIPLSDQINLDAWDREQILNRVEQAELSSIFTYFIGMTMSIFFLCTFLAIWFNEQI